MSSTWINTDNMMRGLKERMNLEMQAAAEPVIRKAVEDAEKEMRKRLGAMVVALIDNNFSVERMGNDLRILVKHDKGINH